MGDQNRGRAVTPPSDTGGKRETARFLAADLVFSIVVGFVSVMVGDYGVAFFIVLAIVVAGYVAWRIAIGNRTAGTNVE